jgi:predicted amidohydrolase
MLKTAVLQMSLVEGDVDGNSRKAHEMLEDAGASGVKLAVLPEMWWTGFSYRRLPEFVKDLESSLGAVGDIARRHGMAVVGGWPEGEGGRIFNTAFAIGADGEVKASYRKVHLFSPMKEDLFLARGSKTVLCEVHGTAVGMILCYDLRFPEMVRRLALDGARILAVPSQWPDARVEHFWTLLRARAIENQIFVAGANRCGKGGKVRFGGYSGIIGPLGETPAECGSHEGAPVADEARKDICYVDDRIPEVDDISTGA